MSVHDCMCLYVLGVARNCLYVSVCSSMCLYVILCACLCLNVPVCACMCLYVPVCPHMFLYMLVCAGICLYALACAFLKNKITLSCQIKKIINYTWTSTRGHSPCNRFSQLSCSSARRTFRTTASSSGPPQRAIAETQNRKNIYRTRGSIAQR